MTICLLLCLTTDEFFIFLRDTKLGRLPWLVKIGLLAPYILWTDSTKILHLDQRPETETDSYHTGFKTLEVNFKILPRERAGKSVFLSLLNQSRTL